MFRRWLPLRSALGNSPGGLSGRVVIALLLTGLALSVAGDQAPANAEDAPAEFDWVSQFGTSERDEALGVGVDSSGTYVAGTTRGGLGSPNLGGFDAFVRKYDHTGNEVWTRQFGTADSDSVGDIYAGFGGVYVVGNTLGAFVGEDNLGGLDIFIRKYDLNGNQQWTDQFGTTGGEYPDAVSADSTGVYVVGHTDGVLPGQANLGSRDAFIRKYDHDGTVLWTRQFGTSGMDDVLDVSVDTSGVYLSGETRGAFPGFSNAGEDDGFVRKYDSNGLEEWTVQFGTSSSDAPFGISVNSGALYVGGTTRGTFTADSNLGEADVFLRKYQLDGTEVWTRQFGFAGYDEIFGVAATPSAVYISGIVSGTLPGQISAGGWDAFVREYDHDGNELRTRQFGTSSDDQGLRIAANSDGVYAVGSVDAGAIPGGSSSGGPDGYIVKLLPVGMITGTITESAKERPLKGAVVNTSRGQSAITDRRGNYTLERVLYGYQTFTAAKDGYTTQTKHMTVDADVPMEMNFVLESAQKGGGGGPDCDKHSTHPKCQ